jgi:hypothetical protein
MTADVHLLAHETKSSVAAVCRVLELPRSTMYARQNRKTSQRAKDTAELDVAIKAVHEENKGRYGSPRAPNILNPLQYQCVTRPAEV